MEITKKIAALLLCAVLLQGCASAYNKSFANSSESYTYDEIPDRAFDSMLKTFNSDKDGFGGVISNYVILIILTFLFVAAYMSAKRFLP